MSIFKPVNMKKIADKTWKNYQQEEQKKVDLATKPQPVPMGKANVDPVLTKNTEDLAGVWKPQYETSASWQGNISGPETANTDAIQRRYGAMQQSLRNRESAAGQSEQDALTRRFASMGALNSGAALRNSRLQADMSNRRAADAANQLYAAQSGEEQGAWENAAARNLSREGMKLQSEEAMRGRNSQREGLAYNAAQAAAQRGLTRESWAYQAGQGGLDRNLEEQKLQLSRDQLNQQVAQYLKQNNLADKEFALNQKITDANLALQSQKQPNWLQEILPFTEGWAMDKPLFGIGRSTWNGKVA